METRGMIFFVSLIATAWFVTACETAPKESSESAEVAPPVVSQPLAPLPKLQPDRAHLVGREMADLLVQKEQLLDSDKVSLYVNRVGQYAAYHLDTGPKNLKCIGGGEKIMPMNGFRFGVIHTKAKETIALPGGFIFISDALLADMKTEDQLAGVLAHEAINVVCQHGMSRVQKVLDSVPKDQQAAAYERVWKMGLPIRFKKVADRGAMLALFKAGYFPEDYVQFVEKSGGPDANERATWMKKDLAKMQAKGVVDTKKSRNARFLDFKRMAGL